MQAPDLRFDLSFFSFKKATRRLCFFFFLSPFDGCQHLCVANLSSWCFDVTDQNQWVCIGCFWRVEKSHCLCK